VQFLDVNPELGNSYNEVIAPQDIATYGGLCALASFDRSELKACILFSISFNSAIFLQHLVYNLV